MKKYLWLALLVPLVSIGILLYCAQHKAWGEDGPYTVGVSTFSQASTCASDGQIDPCSYQGNYCCHPDTTTHSAYYILDASGASVDSCTEDRPEACLDKAEAMNQAHELRVRGCSSPPVCLEMRAN
jgi:hypothetical protein